MAQPGRLVRQEAPAARLRRAAVHPQKRNTPRVQVPGPEQRAHVVQRHLHRRRARHVQGRRRGGAEGHAGPDGLSRCTPNGVMAKCPSKYEAKAGAADAAGAPAPDGTRHKAPTSRAARSPSACQLVPCKGSSMASLGSFLLLLAFVIAAYAAAASVAGRAAPQRRLVESGIGAFYTVAAVMTVASRRHRLRVRHRRLLDPLRPALLRQRRSRSFYKITSYWGGLDGSVMFWVFLLSLFGVGGGAGEPRAPPRADPLRRRHHRGGADVLPLPDDLPQQPVRDLPHRSRRRTGAG